MKHDSSFCSHTRPEAPESVERHTRLGRVPNYARSATFINQRIQQSDAGRATNPARDSSVAIASRAQRLWGPPLATEPDAGVGGVEFYLSRNIGRPSEDGGVRTSVSRRPKNPRSPIAQLALVQKPGESACPRIRPDTNPPASEVGVSFVNSPAVGAITRNRASNSAAGQSNWTYPIEWALAIGFSILYAAFVTVQIVGIP